ncbi:hypothetical protein ABK040_002966 [Willaertia magna]
MFQASVIILSPSFVPKVMTPSLQEEERLSILRLTENNNLFINNNNNTLHSVNNNKPHHHHATSSSITSTTSSSSSSNNNNNSSILLFNEKLSTLPVYSYNFENQKLLKDFLKQRGHCVEFTDKQIKSFKECTDNIPHNNNNKIIAISFDPTTNILQTILSNGKFIHWKINPKTSDITFVQLDKNIEELLLNNYFLECGVICSEFIIIQNQMGELIFIENPIFHHANQLFTHLEDSNYGNLNNNNNNNGGNVVVNFVDNLLSNFNSNNNPINIKLFIDKTQEDTLLKTIKMNLPKTFLCGQATRNSLLVGQISLRGTFNQEMIQIIGSIQSSRSIVFYTFSTYRPNTFHTLELSPDRKCIIWCIYEIIGRQVKKSKYKTIETENEITCCAIGPSEKHVVVCCENGEVRLFVSFKLSLIGREGVLDQKASKYKCITVQTLPGKFSPTNVEWHPSGSMILVSTSNEMCLFDCGLNIIDFQIPLHNNTTIQVITPSNILGQTNLTFSSVQFFTNNNVGENNMTVAGDVVNYNQQQQGNTTSSKVSFLSRFRSASSSTISDNRNISKVILPYERILICFDRGPMCIFKIDFGLLSAYIDNNIEPASNAHFLSIHLNIHNKLKEGYSIIRNLTNAKEFQLCLKEFLSYLVSRIHIDPASEKFLDMLLEKYGDLHKHLQNDSYFHVIYKRYFLYTLRKGYFEKCFQIAHYLNDTSLFEYLYKYCVTNNYDLLAYLSLQHTTT